MIQGPSYYSQQKPYIPSAIYRPLQAPQTIPGFSISAYNYPASYSAPFLSRPNLPVSYPRVGHRSSYPQRQALPQQSFRVNSKPTYTRLATEPDRTSDLGLQNWILGGVSLALLGGTLYWLTKKSPDNVSDNKPSSKPLEDVFLDGNSDSIPTSQESEEPQTDTALKPLIAQSEGREALNSSQTSTVSRTKALSKKTDLFVPKSQSLSTQVKFEPVIAVQYKPTEAELEEMLTAIQGGDTETVNKLLAKGFSPNQILNERKFTPLCQAADHQQHEIVNTLLQYKADPNFAPSNFGSPLIRAVMKGNSDIVRALLAKGAEVDLSLRMYGNIDTAIKCAAWEGNPEVFQLLLDAGADPQVSSFRSDLYSDNSDRPIIIAVMQGHHEIIKKLSNYQLNQDLVWFAIKTAATDGTPEVVQTLAEDCIPDEYQRRAALEYVFRRSSQSRNFPNLLRSEYLRHAWGDDYMLGWTLDYDMEDNLKLLLETGLNPNHNFSSGKKPLDGAQSYKAAALLLQYGATTELESTKRKLPGFLKDACNANDVESAQIFLEQGVGHPDEGRGSIEPSETVDYKNYRKVVMALLKQSVQRHGGMSHPLGHLFRERRNTRNLTSS